MTKTADRGAERVTRLERPRLRGTSTPMPPTRAAALLRRVRLHLTTQRFLAELRGDAAWEAACVKASKVLRRLELRINYLAGRVPR